MRVAIHQPNFMPWRGWFAKLMQADVMVLLDDVQFEKGGYTNRVQIWDGMLTLPVNATANKEILDVNEVDLVAGGRWRRKLRETLRHRYGRTPGYEIVDPWFDESIHNVLGEERLVTVNVRLLDMMADVLGITTPMVWASQLRDEPLPGTEGLVQLLKTQNATEYLYGAGAKSYQDDELLVAEGISVSKVRHRLNDGYPTYGLSAVDTICRHPHTARQEMETFAV